MIKKTFQITLTCTKATGLQILKIGTQSVLNGKRIRSIFTKKHFSAQAPKTNAFEDHVIDDFFANAYIHLVDSNNTTLIDMLPISVLNNSVEKSGQFNQLDISNVDFEKSSLIVATDTNIPDQTGKKIVLNVVYE